MTQCVIRCPWSASSPDDKMAVQTQPLHPVTISSRRNWFFLWFSLRIKETSHRSITTGYSLWFISWNPIPYSRLQQLLARNMGLPCLCLEQHNQNFVWVPGCRKVWMLPTILSPILCWNNPALSQLLLWHYSANTRVTQKPLKQDLLEQQDTLRKLRSHCFHPMPKAYLLHFICICTQYYWLKGCPKQNPNRSPPEHFLVKVYPNPASIQNSEIWTHFMSWHWYK